MGLQTSRLRTQGLSLNTLLRRLDFSYIYAFLGEATLGLTFVFYIILGRTLGPDQYGVFASANALGGILAFFIQFGLHDLLAREIAADPQEGPKSTTTFLLIESFNFLIILCLLPPLAKVLNFEGTGVIICYFVVIAGVCRCAKQTLRSVFRGLGRFRSETISVTLERSTMFLLASTVLFFSNNLLWVVGTLALVRLIDIIGLFSYLSRKVSIASPINLERLRQSFQMAYPFALSGVLWVLYYQIDILMLKGLAPAEETGFYGAAYGLIEIFAALPRVIFYVALTRFSRCYAEAPNRLPEKIQQSTCLLLAVVLPFITVAGFSQTLLVNTTYGQAFLPSIDSLAILLSSLSMKMFASLVLYLLQATRREKALPPILLVTVIINIIANAIFIPQLGAVGAALATLLSEIIFAIAGLGVMIRMGYKRVGQILRLIAVLSLLAASTPALIAHGLSLPIGVSLLVFCSGLIMMLTRRRYFLQKSVL